MAAQTVVMNLLDDRTRQYDMAPDKAVIAAYEQFERNNFAVASYPDPQNHPEFSEHRRGYACGDWIAYKKQGELTAA